MDDPTPSVARFISGNLLTRRAFLIGTGLCFVSACTTLQTQDNSTADSQLDDLDSGSDSRVGVLAIDTRDGARLSHRADERFAMCSTSKLLISAAVLTRVDRGEISLNQQVHYSSQDLAGHAPVAQAHLAEGFLSVEMLLQAAMEESDNTAANLLESLVGGPPGLTQFVRQQGDQITRLDRIEPACSENFLGDVRDTTTPRAMLALMQKIILGHILSDDSRQKLTDWMKNCHTGKDRLRAGLPKDWTVADKTGTGGNGAANDVAILWPPTRPPILIAAFLSGSSAPLDALAATHAKIGAIVAGTFT